MLYIERWKFRDSLLAQMMHKHYSSPKGFVGRMLIYRIRYDTSVFGFIVAGSATKNLPGRNEFFGKKELELNSVINNVFFHIEKIGLKYPIRNFSTQIISKWRSQVKSDWEEKYGNKVVGFETLVEIPRIGECYRRDGWTEVGITKGYTCKRTFGKSTDSWSGKRIWDTENLRPKRVLCRLP